MWSPGKSTLIRCLNGIEEHETGRVTVHGTALTRDDYIGKVRENVGMVFQQ